MATWTYTLGTYNVRGSSSANAKVTLYYIVDYTVTTTNTATSVKIDSVKLKAAITGSISPIGAVDYVTSYGVNWYSAVVKCNGVTVATADPVYSEIHSITKSGTTATMFGGLTAQSKNRSTSAQSITISISGEQLGIFYPGHSSSGSGTNISETFSASTSVSVPALASYTVSYAANGGSSTPLSQTKYYGVNLSLRAAISRTGYTFRKWKATNGTEYSGGGTYSANAATTMTAQWTANTYTVAYNANGGTGTTASSSHTYDTAKNLTANGFTRADYIFKGWSTSANGSVQYTDGQSVINLTATSGGTVTLYAVWEWAYISPDITEIVSYRVDSSSSTGDDYGTHGKVIATVVPMIQKNQNGTTSYVSTAVKVYYKVEGDSDYTLISGYPTINTPQTITAQYISATIGIDSICDIKVVAEGIVSSVVKESATLYDKILTATFFLDFNPNYYSVGAFGAAPDEDDVFYINGDIYIEVDTNAATGTVDGDLAAAITALGWDNDVYV